MRLVHAEKKNGNLAVVGVMFEEGDDENNVLTKLWKTMPEKVGSKSIRPSPVQGDGILPVSRDYYRFNGSLTTPPCSEGVLWSVMKQPITASRKQLKQFSNIMPQPTNRPVQPLNSRPVLE